MVAVIDTERLRLRPWTGADASEALAIFGTTEVAAGLNSGTGPVTDVEAMRALLARWAAQDAAGPAPAGHWALELRAEHRLIGGLSIEHAPWDPEDVRMSWELAPAHWGHGYATESGDALARWAIHEAGVHEVFAVIQPHNDRAAATAKRIGMAWVRETGLNRLQVYRIRHGDVGWES